MRNEKLSEQVINFVLRTCANEFAVLSVGKLAQAFGVSRFKLLRIFKRETSRTLESYLMQEKMFRAALYLRSDNELTVKEVAKLVGFSKSDYFIKVFKGYFGIVPGQYRECLLGRSGFDRRNVNGRRKGDELWLPEVGNRRKNKRDRRVGPRDRRRPRSSTRNPGKKK